LPGIRQRKGALQPLDLRDDLLDIHAVRKLDARQPDLGTISWRERRVAELADELLPDFGVWE
jgi:hypothetical protein